MSSITTVVTQIWSVIQARSDAWYLIITRISRWPQCQLDESGLFFNTLGLSQAH